LTGPRRWRSGVESLTDGYIGLLGAAAGWSAARGGCADRSCNTVHSSHECPPGHHRLRRGRRRDRRRAGRSGTSITAFDAAPADSVRRACPCTRAEAGIRLAESVPDAVRDPISFSRSSSGPERSRSQQQPLRTCAPASCSLTSTRSGRRRNVRPVKPSDPPRELSSRQHVDRWDTWNSSYGYASRRRKGAAARRQEEDWNFSMW